MTDRIFLNQVKDVMQYKNINSEQLAKMIDVNLPALNVILSERVRCTLPIALKIAQALNISLDQLISMERHAKDLN